MTCTQQCAFSIQNPYWARKNDNVCFAITVICLFILKWKLSIKKGFSVLYFFNTVEEESY